MDTEKKAPDMPSLPLMQLLMRNYDDLVEVDMNTGRMRALRHREGKYFVPLPDVAVDDMLRYSAEHMIHPEDQEAYIAFNRPETLAQQLKESDTPGVKHAFFRYRLLAGGWRRVEQVNIGGREQGLPDGVYYAFLFDTEESEDWDEGPINAGAHDNSRSGLTGLLWEEDFFARSRELLRDNGEGWALIAIDLENFKLFNEWYGRKQGDLLLAEVGARLSRAELEEGGLASYFGQDDFTLLVPYDGQKIETLYEELHALIAKHGNSVGFLPAFGVTPVDPQVPVEELYDRASLAAHRAKDSFHTRICTYDPVMFRQTERDYQILSDFQTGLEEHELFIVLQPQCNISTGRVVGAESLVRWRKGDGQMISPGVFVPVLEEYGFVTDLDKYVWEEVCAWQKNWIDGGHTPLPVSVNVSQIDIFTIDVPDYFEHLIQKYGLPTGTIKVEITESAYVDNDAVADTVRRLREKGFFVLMDDFGSGYSSLNMLRSLNVDVIKLDAQFLRMNSEDRKGVQIVESIINMAKTMGVPIIVEGVETREETDFLAGLGCRYVQGYFFYRPMPVSEFETLISDVRRIDTYGIRFKSKDQFHTREFLDQSMFSDAMLNNILGPVAFFAWHGDDVDILRYNQQFYQETKSQHFSRRTKSIQRLLVPEDVPVLYALLEEALKRPLNGASGVLRFVQTDGSIYQYRLRFFYMEEDDNSRKFYCSAQNLTKYITLNDHVRLLSMVSTDTTVFLRERRGKWTYQVVVHGLEREMGLSREQLSRELADKSFFERISPQARQMLQRILEAPPDGDAAESAPEEDTRPTPVRFTTPGGRKIALRQWLFHVHDRTSGVKYILLLRGDENS